MMLPTKHTNTPERNFADKKSPNAFASLVCFVGKKLHAPGSLLPFRERVRVRVYFR